MSDLRGLSLARLMPSSASGPRSRWGAELMVHGMTITSTNGPYPVAVHTQGLSTRFGSRAALQAIDLEVLRGTAAGVLGANGAGKTTLIRLLLGLAKPTSGTIRVLGRNPTEDRAGALARVGAIIEEPRFHPHLTGRENCSSTRRSGDRDALQRVDGALERVGLAARADDKVKTYSLGMRQRLGVARCLLPDPELLILDEPMTGSTGGPSRISSADPRAGG
jgi:ABC-2 type transport system ATP-binding protein